LGGEIELWIDDDEILVSSGGKEGLVGLEEAEEEGGLV